MKINQKLNSKVEQCVNFEKIHFKNQNATIHSWRLLESNFSLEKFTRATSTDFFGYKKLETKITQ